MIYVRTIVGVAVLAMLVAIVGVGTIAVTDSLDAMAKRSESVAAGSSSGFKTAVCGPDVAHACQSSTG
jgi:hypothetical protein